MKRLWSAAALLLVLLGGALWNAWYADRLSGRMAGQLEQAQELADRGDWEGARIWIWDRLLKPARWSLWRKK